MSIKQSKYEGLDKGPPFGFYGSLSHTCIICVSKAKLEGWTEKAMGNAEDLISILKKLKYSQETQLVIKQRIYNTEYLRINLPPPLVSPEDVFTKLESSITFPGCFHYLLE